MTEIRIGDLQAWFAKIGEVMTAHADELCEMDAKMGDGDLGLTMKKGFSSMPAILDAIDEADMGKKLMKAGMKMASVVPSTMGTLMASGVMTGGKELAGKESIGAAELLIFFKGYAAGIAKRGKCARGERTVLDAVGAAADKLEAALTPDMTLEAAAEIALEGAKEGVEATRNMEPKYGKAAVHKAAAVGQVDQGACAGMYMVQGCRDYICGGL